MSDVFEQLVSLLALEKIEENLFRGQSQDLGWGRVFGGQVLGQALSAAVQTVPENRKAHSLHAYFLRSGDVNLPIIYEVDRIRDGRSFNTRRVVAIQKGKAIFNMSASFQIDEKGFEHADIMPSAPLPETLQTDKERVLAYASKLPDYLSGLAAAERPFEVRVVNPTNEVDKFKAQAPNRMYWLRAGGKLPDNPAIHKYMLAYISDYSFLTTSLLPHGETWISPSMQVATLDHAMWFHRPFRVDDFLLHVIDSPSAFGARGLVRGKIFAQDGTLVASTVQEGLIRKHG